MTGVELTLWTIRGALVCYALYVAAVLLGSARTPPRLVRSVWTAGCVLFVAHVACAFHFHHHWSHQAAWQKTAVETEQLLGFAFGDGIYFSYLFLVLWVFDVLWLWTAGSQPIRSAASARGVPPPVNAPAVTPSWRVAVHVFLLFIALNGAIVFEAGVTRWAGIPVSLLLLALAVRRAVKVIAHKPAKQLPLCETVHRAPASPENSQHRMPDAECGVGR